MAEISHPEASSPGSTQANTDQRPVYEVGFHCISSIGEQGVPAVVESIRAALQKNEAEIISEQFPVKTALAYTVERAVAGKREKHTESYFGWVKFALEREHLPAFQESLRSMSDVLRYIVVETVRQEQATPRRAIFTSDRLEGQTLEKKPTVPEEHKEISEEELEKGIEAIVS